MLPVPFVLSYFRAIVHSRIPTTPYLSGAPAIQLRLLHGAPVDHGRGIIKTVMNNR